MDFSGQKLAELVFTAILTAFSVVGFILGWSFQQFSLTVYTVGAGLLLSLLAMVPAWPVYKRNPVKWLESVPDSAKLFVESTKEE